MGAGQFPARQVEVASNGGEPVVSWGRPAALGGPGHADRVTLTRGGAEAAGLEREAAAVIAGHEEL